MITLRIWKASKEQARENRLTPWGKKFYKRRKEAIERSFADAKQHHGHRYAHLRGLQNEHFIAGEAKITPLRGIKPG